jgi:hypothetical protein
MTDKTFLQRINEMIMQPKSHSQKYFASQRPDSTGISDTG